MLTICNFHYIRDSYKTEGGINGITFNQFKNQILELNKIGEFVKYNQLINDDFKYDVLNKNYILLTFDDGLKEHFKIFNFLKNNNIDALFFINYYNQNEKKVSNVHKLHLIREYLSSEDLFSELITFLPQMDLNKVEKHGIKHYMYDKPLVAKFKYLYNFCTPSELKEKFINKKFNDLFDEKDLVKDFYLNDDEINQIAQNNLIQNHLYKHLNLMNLDHKSFYKNLIKNHNIIEKKFGCKCSIISYPYGNSDAIKKDFVEILKENNYKFGITMRRKTNNNLSDMYRLNRFDNNDLPGGKFYKKN